MIATRRARRGPRLLLILASLAGVAAGCSGSDASLDELIEEFPQLDTLTAPGTGSCLPLASDDGFTMLVSQSLYAVDPVLPDGLVITDMIASSPAEVATTPVRIPFDADAGGVPDAAPLNDPSWDRLDPIPLPYDPADGEGFALGALLEIPAGGPVDEQEPVITITGFRFEVDGLEGVMPTRIIAYLSSNPMGDDDFCPQLNEGFDALSIPD